MSPLERHTETKMPGWYREAPPEVREAGTRMYEEVLSMLVPDPRGAAITAGTDPDFSVMGVLHRACIGYQMSIYRHAHKSTQAAAESLQVEKSHPHGHNKASARRVFGVAARIQSGRISDMLVRDALVDAKFEVVPPSPPEEKLYYFSEWLKQHPGVSPEHMIEFLVRKHLKNIDAQLVELDPDACMSMPPRAVGHTWVAKKDGAFRIGGVYALHELLPEHLPAEGVMMNNCVKYDRWLEQVASGKTRIFSLGLEVPEGIRIGRVPTRSAAELVWSVFAPPFDRDTGFPGEDPPGSFEPATVQKVTAWAERVAEVSVCRIPWATVEYEVATQRIMQAEEFSNASVEVSYEEAAYLVEALVELSKTLPVTDVKGTDAFSVLVRKALHIA